MIRQGITSVLLFALIDLVNTDSYCWYMHEDYYTVQQKYCKSGCCREVGDDDEICCFEWTVGVIIGICFAAITVLAVVVIFIICCYTMQKKRNRTGTVIDPNAGPNITNTVIYSAASGYSYPHPPSGFYPSSQFPNAPPGYGPPPKYGMYPPAPDSSQSQSNVPPPSYTSATAPAYPLAPPAYPPAPPQQQQQQSYGGYGAGLT